MVGIISGAIGDMKKSVYDPDKNGLLDTDEFESRTRELFLPVINKTGTLTDKGNYVTTMLDAAGEKCFCNFKVPADYVDTPVFKIVYIYGTSGNYNSAAGYSADSEPYTTHTNASDTQAVAGSANDMCIDTVTNISLASLAAGDAVGVYISAAVGLTMYVVGFIFSYTADM